MIFPCCLALILTLNETPFPPKPLKVALKASEKKAIKSMNRKVEYAKVKVDRKNQEFIFYN